MRRLATIALAGLVLVPAAHAATKGPVFGLRAVGNNQRGYFVYTLAAGGSQTGAVIVSNVGNRAGTVKLFTADATTGRTTGTVYETDKQPTRAGSWVALSSTAVTLAPGANKRVSFTVHVPAGTPAGQWVGGIVAETSNQLTNAKSKQKANVQIKIRDLTIVAVQSNVPGPPIVKFVIGQVTTGGQRGFQQVIVHIASNGNVLAKANGTVTIYGPTGKIVEILPFRMDTFLPQTAIDYPVLLKKALGPGDYRATVSLTIVPTAGATKTVIAHPSFSVSKQDVKQVFTSAAPQTPPPGTSSSSGSSKPWALIGAAAGGVLVILLLLFWLLRRRAGRARESRPPETVQHSPSVLAAAAASDEPAFPEPPAAPVQAEPVVPAAPPAAPPPAAAARPAECTPFHFWDVAYERGQLGGDGVWRFPHRCHNCGLELLAADIADASAQADRR